MQGFTAKSGNVARVDEELRNGRCGVVIRWANPPLDKDCAEFDVWYMKRHPRGVVDGSGISGTVEQAEIEKAKYLAEKGVIN